MRFGRNSQVRYAARLWQVVIEGFGVAGPGRVWFFRVPTPEWNEGCRQFPRLSLVSAHFVIRKTVALFSRRSYYSDHGLNFDQQLFIYL